MTSGTDAPSSETQENRSHTAIGADSRPNRGLVIEHNKKEIGKFIDRGEHGWLGQGGFGTVYELELKNGLRVAAKTARVDGGENKVRDREKDLTTEVAILFAAGCGPQLVSVIRVLILLPDIDSTVTALWLLCDLADAGDLEHVMHSGQRTTFGNLIEDWGGDLYKEEGAHNWPLPSITFQILLGLHHLHRHSIIHQVGAQTNESSRVLIPKSCACPTRISNQQIS